MDAGLAPARQTRGQHRHELRTLTYACVEEANGGIVRDITHQGIGLQVMAAVRPQQQLRVRFELCQPRVRVETRGEVSWATHSGQCGIRFLDISPKMARQIDQWIFGNLLEGASLHSERAGFMFARSQFAGTPSAWPDTDAVDEDDGLMVSAAPVHVIELPMRPDPLVPAHAHGATTEITPEVLAGFDWLSQPLSGRGLIWIINTLVIVAALLLFAVVFLSITGEPPRWPLVTAGATAIFVAALYWGFFRLFGGASPGARLARMAGWDLENDEARDARFP
jgi:PilZ domain-containing protein